MKILSFILLVQLQSFTYLQAQTVKLSLTLAEMWERGEADRVYQTAMNRLRRNPNDYIGLTVKGEYEIKHGLLKEYKATLRRSVPSGDAVTVPAFKYAWDNFGRALTTGFADGFDQQYPGVDVLPRPSPVSTLGEKAFCPSTEIAMLEDAGAIAPGWELDIPPAITAFTPGSGRAGTAIILTGSYLTGATAVSMGDTPVTSFTVNAATQITLVAPGSGSSGLLKVTTAAGTAVSSSTFNVVGE